MNQLNGEDMLLDFPGWLNRQDEEMRASVDTHLRAFPEAERPAVQQKLASMYSVAEATGISLEAIGAQWDTLRGGFAERQGWDSEKEPTAFYGKMRERAQAQRDERQLVYGPDRSRSVPALGFVEGISPLFLPPIYEMPGVTRSKEAGKALQKEWDDSLMAKTQEAAFTGGSYVDAFGAWQEANKGKPGYSVGREASYADVSGKAFRKLSETIEKVRPLAEQTFKALSADRKEGVAVENPAAPLRGLTPEEKEAAFRLMTQSAGGANDKGRAQAFMEAVGRSFENLGVGGGTAAWRSRVLAASFKAGDLVTGKTAEEEIRADFLAETAMRGASQSSGAGATRMAERARGGRKLTEEEAVQWNTELETVRDDADTAERARKFAQDTIDPTANVGGWFFRKVVLPAADSAALITSMSLPGAWAPAIELSARSYQNDDYMRLTAEGMAPREANQMAGVMGPAKAALDKLQIGILGKVLPNVTRTLEKFALSGRVSTRAAANITGTLLAETAIELTQDHIIPALVQDNLANDPDFDVTWGEVWREAGAAIPDVMLGMVLLSGFGGLMTTRAQSEAARQLGGSRAAMRMRGYSAEQMDEIQGAPPTARGELLARYLPSKAPVGKEREELVNDVKQEAAKEQAAFVEKQAAETAAASDAADYAIRVTRTGEGWQITKPDGKLVTVDSAEAAARIRDDLRQVASAQEAEALVAVVDQWHGKAGEKETTFTGEIAEGTAEGIKYSRGNKDTREITDPASLDEFYREARMDAQAGGNEEINKLVNGTNSLQFREKVANGAREIVQRLEINQSPSAALTFLHESIESDWREGVRRKLISIEETQRAIASVASAFDPTAARLNPEERAFRERLQRVARGEGNETELRETFSELAVANEIGKRRDGGRQPVGAVTAALDAAIRAEVDPVAIRELGRFRAFLRAARQYFRAVLGTVAALRKAKSKDFEALLDKIAGLDGEQKALATDLEALADGLAFSVGQVPVSTPQGAEIAESDVYEWVTDAQIDLLVHAKNLLKAPAAQYEIIDGVVSVNGKPAELLHGSKQSFTKFDSSKRGESTGAASAMMAHFLTDSPANALFYTISDEDAEALGVEGVAEDYNLVREALSGYESEILFDENNETSSESLTLDAEINLRRRIEELESDEKRLKQSKDGSVSKWVLRMTNPLIVDFDGKSSRVESFTKILKKAQADGRDGVVFRNTFDPFPSNVFAFFEDEQAQRFHPNSRAPSGASPSGQEARAITGLYHGGKAGLKTLELQGPLTDDFPLIGRGVYLTAIPDRGTDYLEMRKPRGHLYSVLAKIRRPFVLDEARPQTLIEFIRITLPDLPAHEFARLQALVLEKHLQYHFLAYNLLKEYSKPAKISRQLERAGFDAVVHLRDYQDGGPMNQDVVVLDARNVEIVGSEVPPKRPIKVQSGADVSLRTPIVELLSSNPESRAPSGGAFSLSPGARIEAVQRRIDASLGRDPAKRRELARDSIKRLEALQFGWEERGIEEARGAASLDKEQAFRQAARRDELEKGGMDAKRARTQAHEEAAEWRREADEKQAKEHSPSARLVRDLRTMKVAFSVFPPEVRGKLDGLSVVLAKLSTDAARLKEMTRFIEKAGGLLEKFLRKEVAAEMRELIKDAEPKREGGKQSKGTLGAEGHRYFDQVAAVLDLTTEEVEKRRAGIQVGYAAEDLTDEQAADLFEEEQILDSFGAFDENTAEGMDKALQAAQAVYDTKRNKWRTAEEKRLKEVKEDAAEATKAVRAMKLKGDLLQIVGGVALNLKSFGEVLDALLGVGHPLAKKWARAAREGYARHNDEIIAFRKRFKVALEAATGERGVKARRILWDMGKKKTVTVERAGKLSVASKPVPITLVDQWEAGTAQPEALGVSTEEASRLIAEREAMKPGDHRKHLQSSQSSREAGSAVALTEGEGLSYTLLAAQEEYAAALDHAGWTPDVLAAIEKQLSEPAKQLRQFMRTEYREGYAPLASIFEGMFGVALPQIKNYAPAAFYHRGAERKADLEGHDGSPAGMRASYLKNRKKHTAAPRRENAFASFMGHMKQVAHWKALAPFTREFSGVLGNPALKEAITEVHGEDMLRQLNQWVRTIEGNGLQLEILGIDKAAAWLQTSNAYVVLAFNLGTLMKQYLGVFGAAYKMPLREYARGFAKLLSGKLETAELFNNVVIQRRLESGYAPEVRDAINDIWTAKPTIRAAILMYGMEFIGLNDAIAATGSSAIYYDYQLREAKKVMDEDAAKAFAMREVQELIAETAQPSDVIDRSLFEATRGPWGRLLFLYASEPRQKTSLWLTAWGHTLTGKATAKDLRVLAISHFIVGPILQAITAIYRDSGDDDEGEDDWEAMDFVKAIVAGPLAGFPLLRELLSDFPDSGVFGRQKYGVDALGQLFTGPKESEAEEIEWYVGRIVRIMKGLDAFTGVAGNVLGTGFRLADNFLPDTEDEADKKARAEARREAKEAKE